MQGLDSFYIAGLSWKYSELSVIGIVELRLCTCLETSEYTTNFQLAPTLETFATRGKVVADKDRSLFCLVFTVHGNNAISFANVAVNRTRPPVLGRSLRIFLPWSKLSFFSFLVVEGLVIFQRTPTATKFRMPAMSVQLSTFMETHRWDWQRW